MPVKTGNPTEDALAAVLREVAKITDKEIAEVWSTPYPAGSLHEAGRKLEVKGPSEESIVHFNPTCEYKTCTTGAGEHLGDMDFPHSLYAACYSLQRAVAERFRAASRGKVKFKRTKASDDFPDCGEHWTVWLEYRDCPEKYVGIIPAPRNEEPATDEPSAEGA